MTSSFILPTQTTTPASLLTLPTKDALCDAFLNKPFTSLRTPAFVVDRAIFARNCAGMHASAKQWNARFRAHVKTHKTAEGTRLQLISSENNTKAVVVSTLMEAWSIMRAGLVLDGTVDDILYGLPLAVNKIADIHALRRDMNFFHGEVRVMIDHPDQVKAVEAFNASTENSAPWSVFVKIDIGATKRAGLVPGTPLFAQLLETVFASPAILVYGFYCHAGNSYASKSLTEASSFLSDEVNAVNNAAKLAYDVLDRSQPSVVGRYSQPFILSVGSTPTAHAFTSSNLSKLSSLLRGELELHAGNYPFCDLQQLATSLIPPTSVSQRVLASVISYYPGRGDGGSDEAMCDAGGIAMSKDGGPWDGFGDVVGILDSNGEGGVRGKGWAKNGWRIGRMSQEHGILVRKDPSSPIPEEENLRLGQVLEIVGQHSCMTAAAYPWYYVVDSSDADSKGEKVVDIWVPWKGW